jgi:hypothetical protein
MYRRCHIENLTGEELYYLRSAMLDGGGATFYLEPCGKYIYLF